MLQALRTFCKRCSEADRDPAVPRYRLTALALAGGYLGIVTMSLIYVRGPDRYGFGISEYQRWCLVGVIGGVLAGVMVEHAVRIAQRPGARFTIREFMVAIAIVAVAISLCGSVGKWALTSDQGSGVRGGEPVEPNRRFFRNR